MIKILPIILVVVLSGCSSEPLDLRCKFQDGKDIVLLHISDDLMRTENLCCGAPFIVNYDITKVDDTMLVGKNSKTSHEVIYYKYSKVLQFRSMKIEDIFAYCN